LKKFHTGPGRRPRLCEAAGMILGMTWGWLEGSESVQ